MFFLEDEIIGLRCLSEKDIELEGGYKDWFNDPEVCKYNSHHRFPMTCSDIENYVRTCNADKTRIVLAIDVKNVNKHIGNISLQQIDLINRQAEIAFIIGDKCSWRNGQAFRSAILLIDHAFVELGLNRIYFGTSKENIGMQKLGEKLGFQLQGVLRQALYKHGRFIDVLQYDLLSEEWRKEVT